MPRIPNPFDGPGKKAAMRAPKPVVARRKSPSGPPPKGKPKAVRPPAFVRSNKY